MYYLSLIGRSTELFTDDVKRSEEDLKLMINNGRFFVIDVVGSIGQAVTKNIKGYE